MSDVHSMCERVLRRLEDIIHHDDELQEFSIVSTEQNDENKSPVLYESHNIGLESWCVRHLYQYACGHLFAVRKKLAKDRLNHDKSKDLDHLLMGALLINPDVATFWAMRRELVQLNVLSFSNEMKFTKLVLTFNAKSNEAFAHRRWMLRRRMQHDGERGDYFFWLKEELEVTKNAANKSANNYHSWTHRIWSMEHLAKRVSSMDVLTLFFLEIKFSTDWLKTNVSEHTGYHYRQYLFRFMRQNDALCHSKMLKPVFKSPIETLDDLVEGHKLREDQLLPTINYLSMLMYDFSNIKNLNVLYCGHESIWCYWRFLVLEMIGLLHSCYDIAFHPKMEANALYNGDSKTNIVDCQLWPMVYEDRMPTISRIVLNCKLFSMLLQWQREFLRSDFDLVRAEMNQELVVRYKQWAGLYLGIVL